MIAALEPRFALLSLVVLASYVAGTAAGFGVVVLATTLGAHLYPLDELLPVLVPTSLVLTATLLVRQRRHVDRALLGRRLLPWMGAGTAIGAIAFQFASPDRLRTGLGLLVVALSLIEIRRLAAGAEPRALTTRQAAPWFLASGVVHGLFATGGPTLVYAMSRLGVERRAFRATLAAVWVVLNVGMTASYAAAGRIGRVQVVAVLFLASLVPAGLAIGERLHARLDERRFRAAVFLVLLVAGAALL